MRRMTPTVLMLCLCAGACYDRKGEARAIDRCETLLTAQELAAGPAGGREGSRPTVRPRDEPRVRDGDQTIFVRRSYDRQRRDDPAVIEPRDYTCIFDKRLGKVTSLSTNGHEQEFLLSESEWLAARQRLSRERSAPLPASAAGDRAIR